MKVLIVEDDPVTRHVLQAMIAKWGYDVEVESNGVDAWLRLRRGTDPVVALVDWMMPGMTGPHLCELVSGRPDAERFYTILFTSKKPSGNDRLISELAGADVHLVKSVDFQELRHHLDTGAQVLESRMKKVGNSWH